MIEIIIPVRNPSDVFVRSIDSLLAQTDRRFSVLVSDNFSTEGLEILEAAVARLKVAGIGVSVVRPPWELGRVQHWNWAHHQSDAAWLKPLFVGDWLEPQCIAVCHEVIEAHPELAFLCFYFRYHRGDEIENFDCNKLSGRISPDLAIHAAVHSGNIFGGPVNTLYRQTAFQIAGGHLTSLPLTADFDLYTRLAMEVPTYIIPTYLGHFMLHAARFAKRGSGFRRESMNYEFLITTLMWCYARTAAGVALRQRTAGPRIIKLAWLGLREWVSRQPRRIAAKFGNRPS